MASLRDPWIDNAKMVLVTVVVVGHAVVLLPTSDLESRAYDFIYYFHIPVFVLLTGYLSKSFRYSPKHLWTLVTTLVLPYILFSWLMVRFRHDVGGEALLDAIWTNPRWPMWYLIVLIMWRLATPLLKIHWAMVPASIAVSLLAGLTNLELFDINRALGLLPFFVIGLHLPVDRLTVARRRGAWAVGLVIFGLIWWLAGHTDLYWGTQWMYYRASYDELGASLGDGVWIRARLIVISLAGCFAALSLVPHRRSILSDMGAYSLVVYLLHGFVVRFAEYRGFGEWLPDSPVLGLAITVVLAVALALVLAWPPLASRLNYLVDPVNSLWKRKLPFTLGQPTR